MAKGFTVSQVTRYFQALRHSSIVMHGYFILGCLGETEEDMLKIADFAARIGIDSLSLTILRSSPYDGLREAVRSAPGYHIREDGLVYSDAIPVERLRGLRREIMRRFYSAGQVSKIMRKLWRSRFITPSRLARMLPAMAGLMKSGR
jgi:radical SAM superfamily enzyme YgiQ (UPF0313 family)